LALAPKPAHAQEEVEQLMAQEADEREEIRRLDRQVAFPTACGCMKLSTMASGLSRAKMATACGFTAGQ